MKLLNIAAKVGLKFSQLQRIGQNRINSEKMELRLWETKSLLSSILFFISGQIAVSLPEYLYFED